SSQQIQTFAEEFFTNFNKEFAPTKEVLDDLKASLKYYEEYYQEKCKNQEENINHLFHQMSVLPNDQTVPYEYQSMLNEYQLTCLERSTFQAELFEAANPYFEELLKHWSQYSDFRTLFTQDKLREIFSKCSNEKLEKIFDQEMVEKLFRFRFGTGKRVAKFLAETYGTSILSLLLKKNLIHE